VFLDIYHLFISQILVDLNIKIYKKNLPIFWVPNYFLGQKIFKRQHPFILKGIGFAHVFFRKKTIYNKIFPLKPGKI
jgi:hypothetical protein